MTNGAEFWHSKGLKRQLLLVLPLGTGFLLLLVGGIIALHRLFGTSLRFSDAFFLFVIVANLAAGAHRGGMTHAKQEGDRQEPGSPDTENTDSWEEKVAFRFALTYVVPGILVFSVLSALTIGFVVVSWLGHEPSFWLGVFLIWLVMVVSVPLAYCKGVRDASRGLSIQQEV